MVLATTVLRLCSTGITSFSEDMPASGTVGHRRQNGKALCSLLFRSGRGAARRYRRDPAVRQVAETPPRSDGCAPPRADVAASVCPHGFPHTPARHDSAVEASEKRGAERLKPSYSPCVLLIAKIYLPEFLYFLIKSTAFSYIMS